MNEQKIIQTKHKVLAKEVETVRGAMASGTGTERAFSEANVKGHSWLLVHS